jgi:hypothetical protein
MITIQLHKIVYLLSIITLFSCSNTVAQPTTPILHLILASATNDASIGNGCQRNHDVLKERISEMARLAEMEINIIEITGNQLNSNVIKQEINKVNVKTNDVLWFYYSGHGVNAGSSWPEFLISGNKLKLNEVHSKLLAKKARFTLTMGDCCNFVINRSRGLNSLQEKSPISASACIKLLKKSEGNIITSSSKSGEFSNYFDNVGGLYTSSFIDVLRVNLRGRDAEDFTWQDIFKETAKLTYETGQFFKKEQNPQSLGEDKVTYGYLESNSLSTSLGISESIENITLFFTNEMLLKRIKAGHNLSLITKEIFEENNIPTNNWNLINQYIDSLIQWNDDLENRESKIISEKKINYYRVKVAPNISNNITETVTYELSVPSLILSYDVSKKERINEIIEDILRQQEIEVTRENKAKLKKSIISNNDINIWTPELTETINYKSSTKGESLENIGFREHKFMQGCEGLYCLSEYLLRKSTTEEISSEIKHEYALQLIEWNNLHIKKGVTIKYKL